MTRPCLVLKLALWLQIEFKSKSNIICVHHHITRFSAAAISVLLIQYVDVRVSVFFYCFSTLLLYFFILFHLLFLPASISLAILRQGSIFNLFVLHVAKITLKSIWRLAHYRTIQTFLKRSRKHNI